MPDSGKFKDLYLNSAHTYPCQPPPRFWPSSTPLPRPPAPPVHGLPLPSAPPHHYSRAVAFRLLWAAAPLRLRAAILGPGPGSGVSFSGTGRHANFKIQGR